VPKNSSHGRGMRHADPLPMPCASPVSALRKRLGEPWIIATVPGVGYRIDAQPLPAVRKGSVDRKPGLSVRSNSP
jgi:DNA-binding winged helix-turn-helix (wHTH) protein